MSRSDYKGISMSEIKERKANAMKKISELLINHPEGLTCKDLCVEFSVSSFAVRSYLKELIDSGEVVISGKSGSTYIYTWAKPAESVDKPEEPKAEVKEAQMPQQIPTHTGGREFKIVRPAINVNQGDVVWCSSRSGDGMFFRYLVITPWARKATVVGIIPEKDPVLDLNNARFVSIGVDPETGEELFADVSNTCSRGYAQFGEKLMRIEPEAMDEVKRVLARYYRFDSIKDDGECDIWKQRCASLAEELDDTKKLLDSAQQAAGSALAENTALLSVKKSLTKSINSAISACEEKDQKIKDLETENQRLANLNKALEESAANHVESDVIFTEDTKEQIDGLLFHIAVLEKELECKNEMITVLKQITFKSLKGGE